MKIKPELLLIKNENIINRKILVTGSDESFISYVVEYVVKQFKNKKYFIDSSGDINKALVGDLFSEKKVLFIIKDYSPKKEIKEISRNLNQSVLISSHNNKKINTLKTQFLKSKEDILIECYPLNRGAKEIVLRNFIEKNNIEISGDIFWYIIDTFENNYVLFVNQLHLLSFLNTKISSVTELEKVVYVENKIEIGKIFFHIFKKNNILVKVFKNNIFSQSDFYIFLNSLKLYLDIIRISSTKEDALSKFPKYLFGEKEVFIKIYNSLDKSKLVGIYSNILKAESLIRKNSNLYFIIGLRFLINTKKIITS